MLIFFHYILYKIIYKKIPNIIMWQNLLKNVLKSMAIHNGGPKLIFQ